MEKDNIRFEYNSIAKRYELEINNNEIGLVYANNKQYETYYKGKCVGYFKSPYTAKNEILDLYYPNRKQERELRKEANKNKMEQKYTQQEKDKLEKQLQHDNTVKTMNEIRENELFRNAFYKAFIYVLPEYKDKTKEEVFTGARIGMNGIALAIIDGIEAINKAIKRNDYEGKIIKQLLENGTIEKLIA
jgi:hypothetical protein